MTQSPRTHTEAVFLGSWAGSWVLLFFVTLQKEKAKNTFGDLCTFPDVCARAPTQALLLENPALLGAESSGCAAQGKLTAK